jgi:hypothetical protein
MCQFISVVNMLFYVNASYSVSVFYVNAIVILFVNAITPGIRVLGTGSNTKNRVRQVTTTFSGEYAIFFLMNSLV